MASAVADEEPTSGDFMVLDSTSGSRDLSPNQGEASREQLISQCEEAILKLCSICGSDDDRKNRWPLRIVVVGKHGAGKSSFINGVAAALSEDRWHEHAYTGNMGLGAPITIVNQRMVKCSNADRERYQNVLLPTIIDVAGLSDEADDKLEELLRLLFYGHIEEDEPLMKVYEDCKSNTKEEVRDKYSQTYPEMRVGRIIFVASSEDALPERLMACVHRAARPSHHKSERRAVPIYGMLTKKDKVDTQSTEYLDKKKTFMQALGLNQSRFLICSNYCDDLDPQGQRVSGLQPELDLPLLRFMQLVCDRALKVVKDDEILPGSREARQNTANGEGGTQGSIQPTTSTPTDFGSVGGGQVKGEEEARLNKLSRLVWRHKAIIMSYTLNAVCLVMLGMVFVERPCPESMVQVITDRVVSNDSVLGEAVLEKYFQREDAGKRIVREVIPALRDEAQKVNITVVKQKRLEYGCLVSMEKQWQQFKRDLEKAEEELERKYRKKLEKEMEAFALTYRQKLIAAQADFDKEMSKTKVDINSRLHKNQETVSHTVDDRINTETEKLNKRMEDISTTLGLRDKLLEVQGFLKIDSIGPVLVILGVVEALLSVCICMLFGRSFSGAMASRPPRQQRGANADQVPNGGNTVQRQQQQQPPPININNSNVVALCFRNADEKLSRRLGAKLVDSCSSSRGLQLRTYVVNSMEDVPEIPACRAVLVFVDPDEREMIIEDERYHIGQGLRRHALQRLMDSGVEAFIIIFNDQMSVTLNAGELYNIKLGQVDEHAQLKRLKRKDRVVSIKDQFHQHQTSLIVGQLNSVFG